MTFITRLKKNNTFKTIIAVIFWLLLWSAASYLIGINNSSLRLFLPSPVEVLGRWGEIAFTNEFLMAVLYTILRVISGFLAGAAIGFILGVLTHISEIADTLLSPILKIIRAIPVVAIIILMYLFFDSNILPVIIVVLMVAPLIWQTVHDGLSLTDKELLEMAQVYKISKTRVLFSLKLPLLLPSLFTALANSLGLAWKSGVAAEVIAIPSVALGQILASGRSSIEYTDVYAVTLTVVVLSIVIEILIKYFIKKILEGRIYIENPA